MEMKDEKRKGVEKKGKVGKVEEGKGRTEKKKGGERNHVNGKK